jgi:hypothetical protein
MRFPRRLPHFVRRLFRSTVAVLFAVAYLISVVGLPLPSLPPTEEIATQPHFCGCGSEGQCCNQCCCCAPHQEPPKNSPSQKTPSSKNASWTLAMKARQCQGLDSEWVAAGASLAPPAPVFWTFDWNLVGRLETLPWHPFTFSPSPAERPPRLEFSLHA